MRKVITSIAAAAALATGFGAAPALAADQEGREYGKPTQISFASLGGIRDWHAEDDRSIYIRDRAGRWYYATFSARCPSLPFEQTVAFESDVLGTFDSWGVVRTPRYRCHVDSIVASPAPEAKGGPARDR